MQQMYNATTQAAAMAAQQQLLQQQQQQQQHQLRRTRSQQSPQQQPSQMAMQQIPPQGHQYQFQGIPQSHMPSHAAAHHVVAQKQLQSDQLAYNPNMYVSSPDQHLLQGLQPTAVNSSYNPSDIQFQFSQYEDPALLAAAAAAAHHPHAYQRQINSNSPDPVLAHDAFAYRQAMQRNGVASPGDPVGQRTLSPLYQQQAVMNPSPEQYRQSPPVSVGPGTTVYAPEGDWRVNNSPLYQLDPSQYQTGYLGLHGQLPSNASPSVVPAGLSQQHIPVNHQMQHVIPHQQQQQPQQQPQPQQHHMVQQMVSVGPSDDIVDRRKSVEGPSAEQAEVKKPKPKKKKAVPVVPPSPKLVGGSDSIKMDMEKFITFDLNLNEDKSIHPNVPVSLVYEPIPIPAPIDVDSPDAMASPPKKAKTKAAKAKTAKPPVTPDPISQMKDRMVNAFDDADVTVPKVLSLCWTEMKAISEEDKDGDEKRIAWLKTVFDNGFDELFRLMTNVSQIIKRIRKWSVDAYREDKNSPIILYCLQVYQKLSLDEKDMEEYKLVSVLNTFSKNTRDEKVKQACAHILSRAAKFTAKLAGGAKKTGDVKVKTEAGAKATTNGEAVKTEKKVPEPKPAGISKADGADILKDAAKIASLSGEDAKLGKRKPGEALDKEGANKKFAAASQPTDKPRTVQLPIAPESKSIGAAKPKSSEGFFAIQKTAKPKPAAPAPQPSGFTSIFDLLKEREAANAAAQDAKATEKPAAPAKKKKTVRWKPDEELNQIKIFKTEVPEGEEDYDPMEHDGLDFGSVQAKVRANLKEEAQALKNRNFDDDDEFEIDWDTLTPIKIFWPPDMVRNTCFKRMGAQQSESSEAQKQQERERNVLAVQYSKSLPAPPTPAELSSVHDEGQPIEGYWEASMLRPPPGWKRERSYLFGDSYQKKNMAKAYMPQHAAPAAPAAPAVSQVDLSSILANLGGGQSAVVQQAPQEAQKPNQLASILAELSKLAPQAQTSTPPTQVPTPAPAPPVQNPLLALLGMQNPTPQPQVPTPQPQFDLSQALQHLAQQQQPQQVQQPQPQPQPQQQPQQQNAAVPFANFPFPFPPFPPQPGQAAAPFPFMPFPPPLPGQNPADMLAMYQTLMNPQNVVQAQQVQQVIPQQQPGQTLNEVLTRLNNPPTGPAADTNMNDNDDYQPGGFTEERTLDEKILLEAPKGPSEKSDANFNNKEGKGSWSKFGKKKKGFAQHQQPYTKEKGGKDGGKRVCAFWQAGGCLKGDDCQYSHDGPPGQGGTEQADQIRAHLYGKDAQHGGDGPRGHDNNNNNNNNKKHKKFKKNRGYGGSGSAADTAAANAANDWNGEMEY